jgi:protein phosphatase
MRAGSWRLEAAVRSDKGRVRKNNQDSYGFFPDLGLFMVADGLGGHQGGEVASRMTVDAVRDALAASHDDDMTPMTDPQGLVSLGGRRLLRALEEANASVWDAGRVPEYHGMGTTVVALLFDRGYDVVAVCHVGDSRVFRMRGGEVVQLTEDHTVVQQWVREGRIGPEEAARSPHRHMITQAVGTQEAVEPAVRLERPQVGDVYVLTSDGIHDTVTPDEIAAVLRGARSKLEQACMELIDLANQRGGRDNSTVLLVRVAGEGADDTDDVTASL